MTVRQWKRVITGFVVLLIITLGATAAYAEVRYQRLATEFEGEAVEESADSEQNLSIDYQKKFDNLYVQNDFEYKEAEDSICYLTFDDGPSTENTEKILDILKKYNIKATFFVIYKDTEKEKAMYKRIVEEGHTIGVHTASHDYEKIYSSVDAYLKDFNKIASHIEEITGEKPEIFRFPGGSVNSYNGAVYMQIVSEMMRRGYTYYDWNVGSGDASYGTASKNWIVGNVVNGAAKEGSNIILMHDTNAKDTTVQALPEIIEKLSAQGYRFDKLTKEVKPVTFSYLS